MAGCPREGDRTRSDGNSQHHIGVLEQDAPLATASTSSLRRASPDVDPGVSLRALSYRTPMSESGTINRERLLIRLRPFMCWRSPECLTAHQL